jgi:hypothetical protein
MLLIRGANIRGRRLIDLVFDTSLFPGQLHVALPPGLFPKDPREQAPDFVLRSNAKVKRWATAHIETAKRLYYEAKYPEDQYSLLVRAIQRVAGQQPLVLNGGVTAAIRDLPLTRRDEHAVFFRIDLPSDAKIGSAFYFDVTQVDSKSRKSHGGSRYEIVVNREAR